VDERVALHKKAKDIKRERETEGGGRREEEKKRGEKRERSFTRERAWKK